MAIILNTDDLTKLVELTNQAKTTPMIGFGMRQMLERRDLATLAWDRVRQEWERLGNQYGFEPTQVKGIDPDTGEVFT